MANSLQWSLLSLDQVSRLQMDLAPTEDGAKQFRDTLASFLNLSLATINAKTEIILDFHFISFFSPSRELHESTGAHAPHLSSLMLRKYVVLGTCLQIPRPIYVYKYIHANVYTQSYCIQFG